MASRTELRSFLEQRQSTSLPSNRESTGRDKTKRSGHNRKECGNDELVKYMSKLPGYLERREESLGSNVLNVGVLDWGRLEKWKHGRARDGERNERKVFNNTTIASTSGVVEDPNVSHRCKIDDGDDDDDKLRKGKASRDLQHSLQRGDRCALEPELASRDLERAKNPVKSRRTRLYQESAEMGNSGGSQKKAGEVHGQEEARERCTESGEEKKIVGDSKADQFINVVLPRSRKQSRSTLSGVPVDDDNMRVARGVNRSIDFSNGLRSQIPRSFDLERDSEDVILPLSGKKERRHSKTASRIFDQELREDNDESRKNRDPSPSKRFSFSFGRLSRSFTSKEDSSRQQPLSSSDDTIKKSESMRFNGSSVCPSQSNNTEKQQCGSRISPLRRFLDPLLKSKVSENVLPLQESRRRTRALFQLTIRNGIPLFQFVVEDDINNNNNNNRSILGATMNNSDSSSSFKDDSVRYCTFYSVNEVKKKKSWLIHGGGGGGGGNNKEKQRGFVYNIIGQMRLSNNSITSDITENIRESVLFDDESEIAAVVIKKKPMDKEEAITVIIPGGVHSLPEKGGPSPLISRWRSGGLCDCGGWDVECKLIVLSNKTLFLNELDQSFKLFNQEGSDSGPVLEMTEMKSGVYKVEFGSFLLPLQAFFVCVTVIDTVVKTTGKSSSPFAPPLSPVGRV